MYLLCSLIVQTDLHIDFDFGFDIAFDIDTILMFIEFIDDGIRF